MGEWVRHKERERKPQYPAMTWWRLQPNTMRYLGCVECEVFAMNRPQSLFRDLFFLQLGMFFSFFFIFMFWMTGRGKGKGRDKMLNLDFSFPERRLGSDAEKSGCNGFAYAFSARIRIIPWRLPGKWKEDTVMPFASCPWQVQSCLYFFAREVGFPLLLVQKKILHIWMFSVSLHLF